jgi:tryptophan synthase alpha chain
MNRIDLTFKRLKQEKRKALIGYVTAGFPAKNSLRILAPLLQGAGLDILELGIPFSDPTADGPTIQYASQIGLANGITLDGVLKSAKDLREKGVQMPFVFMSYCNPLYAMGVDLFFQRAKTHGVDGLIVPDLIPEEGAAMEQAAKRFGVYLIYLAAPTTPLHRLKYIAAKSRGFVYAVSLTGVTGVKKAVPKEVAGFLKTIHSRSRKPVAVGFGITSPAQAQTLAQFSDGVIVGSELIRQIEKSKHSSFKGAIRFVESLRLALDRKGDSYAS